MIVDLGGGTFDVSIVEVTEGGHKINVNAVDGDPLLGGRDVDNISFKIEWRAWNILFTPLSY
jgi:molecular chaperone DnaK (HSP70)